MSGGGLGGACAALDAVLDVQQALRQGHPIRGRGQHGAAPGLPSRSGCEARHPDTPGGLCAQVTVFLHGTVQMALCEVLRLVACFVRASCCARCLLCCAPYLGEWEGVMFFSHVVDLCHGLWVHDRGGCGIKGPWNLILGSGGLVVT